MDVWPITTEPSSRGRARCACSAPPWSDACPRACRRLRCCCSCGRRRTPTPPPVRRSGAGALAAAAVRAAARTADRPARPAARRRSGGSHPGVCLRAPGAGGTARICGAPVLIAAAACAGALVPPIAPVVRTLLRDLYDDHAVRETAYAMEAIAQETIWIVGPMFATDRDHARIARRSPWPLLGVIGVSGTLLFLRSPLLDRPPAHEHGAGASRLGPGERRPALAARTGCADGLRPGRRRGRDPVDWRCTTARGPLPAPLLALWSLGSMAGGIRYSSPAGGSALGSRYALLMLLNCALTAPLLVGELDRDGRASSASSRVWPSRPPSPACTRWWAAS